MDGNAEALVSGSSIVDRWWRQQGAVACGGFGRVYKGVMPISKIEVAVKKVSHESRQGMREFVAEIASIGRLRHRNLVPLLGYCRRKGELLLAVLLCFCQTCLEGNPCIGSM